MSAAFYSKVVRSNALSSPSVNGAGGLRPYAALAIDGSESSSSSPRSIAARKASTTAGSNWVPEQRISSSQAATAGMPARYGRSATIAS